MAQRLDQAAMFIGLPVMRSIVLLALEVLVISSGSNPSPF